MPWLYTRGLIYRTTVGEKGFSSHSQELSVRDWGVGWGREAALACCTCPNAMRDKTCNLSGPSSSPRIYRLDLRAALGPEPQNLFRFKAIRPGESQAFSPQYPTLSRAHLKHHPKPTIISSHSWLSAELRAAISFPWPHPQTSGRQAEGHLSTLLFTH